MITRRTETGLPEGESESGVAIRRVGPAGVGRGKKFAAIPALWSAARSSAHAADVLVVRGTRVLALPGFQVARGAGLACVLQPELNGELDGSLAFWGRKAGRLSLGAAFTAARARNALVRGATVVAMSEAIRAEAIRAGFRKDRVVRIPHGVDPQRFAPVDSARRVALRRELLPSVPDDAVLAIYTGRLLRGKGLETLLDAFERIGRTEVRLAIVGSGDGQTLSIERELRTRVAASEPLRSKTVFAGRTDRIEAYLQASDLFVFPTFDESFGISLVEAQSCGLPAVASRTGGVPDIVTEAGAEEDAASPGSATGVLAPVGDAGAIARGVETLAGDRDLRARMGQSARARVLDRFDFETTADQYEALFAKLARERRR